MERLAEVVAAALEEVFRLLLSTAGSKRRARELLEKRWKLSDCSDLPLSLSIPLGEVTVPEWDECTLPPRSAGRYKMELRALPCGFELEGWGLDAMRLWRCRIDFSDLKLSEVFKLALLEELNPGILKRVVEVVMREAARVEEALEIYREAAALLDLALK